jgi:N-acetylmuramoyl-L-alanine amidase
MKNKALKRLIYGLSALLISLVHFSLKASPGPVKTPNDTAGYKLKTIVVDAGHGGRATGASGQFSLEKNVTLAIALKLQKALQKEIKDVNILMTRTTDEFVDNGKRAVFANNNKGDIYISIHCNSLSDRRVTDVVDYKKGRNGKKIPVYKTYSVPNRSGKGVLLLIYGLHRTGEQLEAIRENEMAIEEKSDNNYNDPKQNIILNAYRERFRKLSHHLANLMNTEFKEVDGRPSNGVKEQGLIVLAHSAMPSVLVETGFINNIEEEKYLNSDEGQTEIVNSLVRAIKQYKKEIEQI